MIGLFRILIRGCLVLGVLVILAVGALAVRLSIGPMEVGFLRAAIESGLSASNGAYRVKAKKAVVAWRGWDDGLLFVLRDVTILKKGGGTVASLPSVAINLDAGRLMTGELAPRTVVIRRPKLLLRRTADGRVTLGIVTQGKTKSRNFVPGLLSALRGRSKAPNPLTKLQAIRVIDAHLVVEDAYLERTWRTTVFNARLTSTSSGIVADMSFNLLVRDRSIQLKATAAEDSKSGSINVAFDFKRLDPALFQAAKGPMAALKWVRLPLSGRFEVRVDRKFAIREARLSVAGKNGKLQIPGYYSNVLSVKDFALTGDVSGDGTDMTISRLAIDFGGPKLTVVGRTRRVGNDVDFNGTVSMTGFPTDHLRRYWPEGAIRNGRKWVVKNISGGRVNSLDVSVALKANVGKQVTVQLQRLRGAFRFTNLTIRFFKHMPPVTRASGIGTFDDKGMKFTIDQANLRDLELRRATVDIDGFKKPVRSLMVDAQASGNAQTALTIIDREPLGFARKMGVSPLALQGKLAFRIKVWVSLFAPVTFQDVGIKVDADISDVHWRKALFGLTFSKGHMKLKVNNRSMSVDATGELEGRPATLTWYESFKPQPVVRRMNLRTIFSTKDLKRMGVEPGIEVDGTFASTMAMEGFYDGRTNLRADMDLRNARIRLPLVVATKPKGAPAALRIGFRFQNQRLTSIPYIELKSKAMSARGRATFYPVRRGLRQLIITSLKAGLTDIALRIDRPLRGPRLLSINGAAIDLSKSFDMRGRSPDEPMPPTIIRAAVKRLYFTHAHPFHDLKGGAVFDGRNWRSINVTARAGKGDVMIRLVDESRRRRLTFKAGDAGATLRALNIYDNIFGGAISVVAGINDFAGHEEFVGRAVMRKFRLRNAPAAARLLALASIRGIKNLGAKDGGIAMDEFVAPMRFKRGLIEVRNARAVGSQVGVTLNGSVNLKTDYVNLNGTIVPAYSINSILGKLLASEKGSGLFAATYRIKGHIDEPKVTVNALAVLTPRILRGLRKSYTRDKNKPDQLNDSINDGLIAR